MYSSYGWASTVKNEGRNNKEDEGCNSELSPLWKETRERSLGLTVHGVQCTYVRTYFSSPIHAECLPVWTHSSPDCTCSYSTTRLQTHHKRPHLCLYSYKPAQSDQLRKPHIAGTRYGQVRAHIVHMGVLSDMWELWVGGRVWCHWTARWCLLWAALEGVRWWWYNTMIH